MIYLDNAATTLRKPSSVYRAVRNAMHRAGTPGRGGHRAAMEAAETVYRCRELAAELFDVPYPEQVVFTMNSTHALNIAIRSLVRPGMRVVVSGYEHNAVMRPLYALGAEIRTARGILFDQADVLSAFRRELREDTGAVVLNHVSNVFGFIQPAAEIADLCRERGIPLILDASQSAGVLPISLKRLGAAFIAMPGHKGLYGPQGTGILLCGRKPEPLLFGGTGSGSRERPCRRTRRNPPRRGRTMSPGSRDLRRGSDLYAVSGRRRSCGMKGSFCLRRRDPWSTFPGSVSGKRRIVRPRQACCPSDTETRTQRPRQKCLAFVASRSGAGFIVRRWHTKRREQHIRAQCA